MLALNNFIWVKFQSMLLGSLTNCLMLFQIGCHIGHAIGMAGEKDPDFCSHRFPCASQVKEKSNSLFSFPSVCAAEHELILVNR